MTHWIWEESDWPNFVWDSDSTSPILAKARLAQGKLLGIVSSFNQETRDKINANSLADEMITTSAIEGEMLNRDSVRSSIAHRLGLPYAGTSHRPDRYIDGLLDMLTDATENYTSVLTLDRLKSWHAALFPTGFSGIQKIKVGQLRGTGEMRIVSGRQDKLKVHYIAPPRKGLETEIRAFLKWFNHYKKSSSQLDGLIRSAISHLWFEILHPFDDGNGRIGRAIADMALAQDENLVTRFYSLSSQIIINRKGYYAILEETSRGGMDITHWLEWYLNCFKLAVDNSIQTVKTISLKFQFWQKNINTQLNERQRKVLNRMMDEGVGGFIGGISTKKYMNLTRVSRATAYRELLDLVNKGCLKPLPGEGRASAYEIDWPAQDIE